jgi:hypothetical protein
MSYPPAQFVGRFSVRKVKQLKLQALDSGTGLALFATQVLANSDPRKGKRGMTRAGVNSRRRKPASSSGPTGRRMKRLTLDLGESLHRAIKKNAAEDGVTMAQKLRTLLSKQYGISGDSGTCQ